MALSASTGSWSTPTLEKIRYPSPKQSAYPALAVPVVCQCLPDYTGYGVTRFRICLCMMVFGAVIIAPDLPFFERRSPKRDKKFVTFSPLRLFYW